jgi:carbamoyltransferase
MNLVAGFGGANTQACAALADGGRLLGVCMQERITRVRGAGFNETTGLPDEALDALLERMRRSRADVDRYVFSDSTPPQRDDRRSDHMDRHLALASAAYLSSPFQSAAIIVCDRDATPITVWEGRGSEITQVEWSWTGPGFSEVYARCARAFGFAAQGAEQRFEALARLSPDSKDDRLDQLITVDGGTSLTVAARLEQTIEDTLAKCPAGRSSAPLASALQSRLGELFIELLRRVRHATGLTNVCVSGNFASHSSINAVVKQAGVFDQVFVPVSPERAGLAVGAVLRAIGSAPQSVSPFLGPAYTSEETKETLDNCKLQYALESDAGAIETAVRALQKGALVAWFDGAMEWGPRALGARSILANPFSPYVLENLNRFLKRREPWRGYALSGLEEAVGQSFRGPAVSPFMECDYRAVDADRFRHVTPAPGAAIRIHTVDRSGPPRFRRLLEAFGAATGLPFLVNTSFNGFHEPIVCSPRDAVRVFYGSGIDLLVLDRFVLKK